MSCVLVSQSPLALITYFHCILDVAWILPPAVDSFSPSGAQPKLYHRLCFFVWSMAQLLSHVWLFATPWIVAHQAALSTECSKQDYWSGVPFLTPGLFLTQGSNPHLLHRLHWLPLSYLGNPTGSFSSVQFSHSVMSDSLWPHGLQHIRSPCPSPTPRVYSNSYSLSQWC